MPEVALIAAAFATREIASLALARLRRFQARREGGLRMAPLGAVGRIVDEVVVAGPVFEDDLGDVRGVVEGLGGRMAVVVRLKQLAMRRSSREARAPQT
jgi:hypothetical protein